MRAKSMLYTGLALGMLLAGCTDEELVQGVSGGSTLKAVMESQPESRVGFVDKVGTFFWTANDEIGVTTQSSPSYFSKMTLSEGAGTGTGTFKGNMSSKISGYAVYPYVKSLNHTLSKNTLTYNFPTEYTYAALDSEYGKNDGTGNSFNAPMWAKVEDDGTAVFKHLGGVIAISVDNVPKDCALKFVLQTPGKKLTGQFTATLPGNDSSLPVLTTENSSNGDSQVTINVEKPATERTATTGYFYVPAPTGTYSQIIATLYTVSDEGTETELYSASWENKDGNLTINRCTILRGNITEQTLTGVDESSVSSVDDVENALKTNASVSVASISGADNTISLPSETNGKAVSISFESVASNDAALTIQEANGATVSSDVTLFAPSNTGNAMDVTINLPNSTVTLAANNETATYDEVTATTAANTLIVDGGVTINSLTVKQGNVRVKAGATITSVAKECEGNVTLYVESGSHIPETLPDGVVAINAEVADLKAVFTEGGTYQLQSDIDIQGQNLQVASGVNAVLDLNGHTVTAANGSGGNIYVAGNFTLRDSQGTGKIVADKDYIKDAYSAGLIYIDGESAKMTMEGGTIYAVRDDAVNKGQFGVGVYDGGDFTMTGGKIEAGWYAVSGNGTNDTQNSLINIQGGELVSTMDYAVYLPHSGTATISGGTINGAAGGISMQRGTLNISGTAQIMSNGEGNTGEWGDGTGNQSNSALMVGGKYGDCTVTMTGGSLTAEKEALIVTGDSGYQINISISGGTFSDPSALAYLAEGADVDVVLAKDVEITKAILINKNVTVDFDLNGKTLLNQTDLEVSGSYETGAFEISAGTLNISDSAGNGAVKCVADNTDNDGFRMAVWAYGTAKVNISGGSFYNSQKKNAQIDLINVQGTAQLYISGGRFESNGYGTPKDGVDRYWVLNRNNGDTNSVIKVSGGTFVNFNPANPNMDDNDNASYLAEGYEVTLNGAVTIEAYNGNNKGDYIVRAITAD